MPENRLPIHRPNLRAEISADQPGRNCFQIIDQPAQFNYWRCRKQQVKMILFAVELDQPALPFTQSVFKYLAQSLHHRRANYLAPVFGNEN